MNATFDWEYAPCGVLVCVMEVTGEHIQYKVESGNQRFLETLDYEGEASDLPGADLLSFIGEMDRERFLQYLSTIQENRGSVSAIECNVWNRYGKLSTIYWSGKQEADHRIVLSVINFDAYNTERKMLLETVHEGQLENNRLLNVLNYLPVGVAIYKEKQGFILRAANKEYHELIGYSKKQMMEERVDLFDCFYPKDRALLRSAIEECRKKKLSKEVQLRMENAKGEIHWVIFQCAIYPVASEDTHFSIACWDISDHKKLEDKLNLLAQQYQLLEDIAEETPIDYEVEGRRFFVPSKENTKKTENKIEEISLEDFLERVHEEERAQVLAIYEEASVNEKKGSIDFRIKNQHYRRKNDYAWCRLVYRSIKDTDGIITHIIGKIYDITTDKENQLALSREMKLDPLTRVLNKVETQKCINECLRKEQNKKHALFLIDVDNFKHINDTFGHTVGDTIIVDIAQRIRESFRNSDLVGRIGGDEFVVFLKDTTEKFAQAKAEELCKNVQKVIYGGDEEFPVTISVGIAISNEKKADYQSLFKAADVAMYKIKKTQKNGFIFQEEEEESIQKERSLPQAIVTNGTNADREILNMAFNLLSHARDLDVSLHLLLEQIGKKFKANLVTVFAYDKNETELNLINNWSDIGITYEKVMTINWDFYKEEPIGVFVDIVESAKRAGYGNPFCRENSEPGRDTIKSMWSVKFKYGNDVFGELNVASVKEHVDWSKEDQATLCELARAVSVFVSLRARYWEDRQTIHMLRHREHLTGLYDKDTYKEKIEKRIANRNLEKQYAIVVLDINNFSYINENFGTEVGDHILCDLAEFLKQGKPHILYASRMYSDYFSAFYEADTKEEILDLVMNGTKEYEASLRQKYPMGSLKLSIGLCFLEREFEYEIVLENANIARKYAKEHKLSNGIVFAEYMREKRDEIVRVSSMFQDAIKNGEFELFLQPKFLVNTFEIYGAETLSRWRMPNGVLLGPGHYVSALEVSGFVKDLDFYMFEKTLQIMRKWMLEGKRMLIISTNFSRKHFEKDGEEFIKRIQNALDFYRVPPEYIEIEITESAVIDNLDVLQKCMEEIQKMGLRIAIDDFGTGYSSLSAVFEIPANVIKMDKQFTDKLKEERKRQFVSKMGMLMKAARQEVLFEGIETQEQLSYLRDSGFKYGQGFLFDRPLSVEEFERKYLTLHVE